MKKANRVCTLKYPLLAILSCLLVYSAKPLQAQETFSINTSDKPPYSSVDNSGIYDLIISHVFNELGVAFNINHLKSARSIENVDIGIDDAEFARIKGLSAQYPNLEIVDEKLIDFLFTGFLKDPNIRITNWNSLKEYNIGFMRGWKIYEKNVTSDRSIHIVDSENELFKMLIHNRVDIILYEKLRGYDYMKKNGITGVHALANPLSVRGMYLYVNRKHSSLIPTIEGALKKMKRNGDYQKILDSFTE